MSRSSDRGSAAADSVTSQRSRTLAAMRAADRDLLLRYHDSDESFDAGPARTYGQTSFTRSVQDTEQLSFARQIRSAHRDVLAAAAGTYDASGTYASPSRPAVTRGSQSSRALLTSNGGGSARSLLSPGQASAALATSALVPSSRSYRTLRQGESASVTPARAPEPAVRPQPTSTRSLSSFAPPDTESWRAGWPGYRGEGLEDRPRAARTLDFARRGLQDGGADVAGSSLTTVTLTADGSDPRGTPSRADSSAARVTPATPTLPRSPLVPPFARLDSSANYEAVASAAGELFSRDNAPREHVLLSDGGTIRMRRNDVFQENPAAASPGTDGALLTVSPIKAPAPPAFTPVNIPTPTPVSPIKASTSPAVSPIKSRVDRVPTGLPAPSDGPIGAPLLSNNSGSTDTDLEPAGASYAAPPAPATRPSPVKSVQRVDTLDMRGFPTKEPRPVPPEAPPASAAPPPAVAKAVPSPAKPPLRPGAQRLDTVDMRHFVMEDRGARQGQAATQGAVARAGAPATAAARAEAPAGPVTEITPQESRPDSAAAKAGLPEQPRAGLDAPSRVPDVPSRVSDAPSRVPDVPPRVPGQSGPDWRPLLAEGFGKKADRAPSRLGAGQRASVAPPIDPKPAEVAPTALTFFTSDGEAVGASNGAATKEQDAGDGGRSTEDQAKRLAAGLNGPPQPNGLAHKGEPGSAVDRKASPLFGRALRWGSLFARAGALTVVACAVVAFAYGVVACHWGLAGSGVLARYPGLCPPEHFVAPYLEAASAATQRVTGAAGPAPAAPAAAPAHRASHKQPAATAAASLAAWAAPVLPVAGEVCARSTASAAYAAGWPLRALDASGVTVVKDGLVRAGLKPPFFWQVPSPPAPAPTLAQRLVAVLASPAAAAAAIVSRVRRPTAWDAAFVAVAGIVAAVVAARVRDGDAWRHRSPAERAAHVASFAGMAGGTGIREAVALLSSAASSGVAMGAVAAVAAALTTAARLCLAAVLAVALTMTVTVINAFVALLLPLFRRWPGPALGYAWIHAFAWTLDLGCVPDVADSIAARFAGLEEVGDSDEDTYPESHTTRSTGHTAALARLQSDAASPRRASPTASPMSLDAVTPARVPSYAAQAQRNTLPRAHSRELQQLQGWGSGASAGQAGPSLLQQLSMGLARAMSGVGMGGEGDGGALDAARGAQDEKMGKQISWMGLRSRMLVRMQTAPRGMDQLINFHWLRNRTVAYEVDGEALPDQLPAKSPI